MHLALKISSLSIVSFGILLLSSYAVIAQQRVDLNIVLAIDCSYSVDHEEFDLQVHGTAKAFTDQQIIEAITQGTHGKIAITVVQWAGEANQVVTVPWTVVASKVDAYKLAIAIKSQPRRISEGSTSMTAMLKKAGAMLLSAPNQSQRMVVDIASDGENNGGGRVRNARDAIVANGITINGLSILNEVSYLNFYFEQRVIGGKGAFVQIANTYADFSKAIRQKLLREILGGGII